MPRRGVLLGLSASQLATVAGAVATVVVCLYVGGAAALAWASPLWGGLLTAAWLPLAGRTAIQWAPVAVVWVWRTLTRQTVYRRRILTPRPEGTLALPGDACALRHYTDPVSGAVMIHDPHRQLLVAVAQVSHHAFVLADPGEQQRRVQGWGRVLSGAARSGRVARVQVLQRTLPGSATGLTAWWAEHGRDDGSWVAATYRDLIARAGPAAQRHVTTISIALDMSAAARGIRTAGGGLGGAATVLRQEMNALAAALAAADLAPVSWLTPARLAVTLRAAYDPQVAAALERSELGGDLAAAGPVAVTETWDGLRSDSAWHATLWIAEWPATAVHPGFLAPMLLGSGATRTFSLICHPVRTDVAARDLRRKKTEYLSDAAQRARIGQVEDPRATVEYHDVLQREADLSDGHALLRYAGLITVTADTRDDLDAAVAEIEQAAVQAGCETRRLVGQQAQAFTAAALPLCRGL